ncbi:MAG: cyclase family protein [Gemmatimonadaceae bacterium]
MRTTYIALITLAVTVAQATPVRAQPINLTKVRTVDLTHPFNAKTLYWPTAPSGFKLQQLAFGPTPGGWFYSANAFAAPEHGGTHLDAPIHFSKNGRAVDQVPVEQLIAPAVVIDIRSKTRGDADYRLSREDVTAWETAHGAIPRGAIVLLLTGWSSRWPNAKAYLGDDTPGDASKLHFPSYGADAARFLVKDRRVGALGVDVASIDYGQTKDFIVHQIAAEGQVAGLENLTNLHLVPPTGAVAIALPMKIEGGSGAPLRAVALVSR